MQRNSKDAQFCGDSEYGILFSVASDFACETLAQRRPGTDLGLKEACQLMKAAHILGQNLALFEEALCRVKAESHKTNARFRISTKKRNL